ncbi:MAG: sialate O-acetylesterase, partial [Alloprevotella sp.]|nr:sialate O-acetylesterase [Alloprevotella sp.]
RRAWHDASLPFHFVQLSGLSTRPSWPSFRDSQRRLADRLPHTWMAVSSDLGDSLDVHPRRKHEVARRLTVSALAHTYGCPTVGNGPHYDGFRTEGQTLRALFSTADGLRAADGAALRGFEVADEDGVFHPAKARIDGTTVVLESPEVKRPCAVRYAYRPYTDANLVNGAGLPASTFIDEPAFEGAKNLR